MIDGQKQMQQNLENIRRSSELCGRCADPFNINKAHTCIQGVGGEDIGVTDKITDEEWFKSLPVSERIIWLRIIRNQQLEQLQESSKIIYQTFNPPTY